MGTFDALSGWSSTAMSWMTTTAFWIIVMIGIVLFGLLFLWIRKIRKFDKIVLVKYYLGDGRINYKKTKGGWFKSRFTLGGLWDYGPENRFRLKDMTPVEHVSHDHYREIDGKTGIVVVRNPNDPKMVFPILREYISDDSTKMMNEVAPADYRDAGSKAIEQTDQEMMAKWYQYAPLIVTGLVIVIALIITLLNTQYGKYMVDKAGDLLMQAKDIPCVASPSPAAVP